MYYFMHVVKIFMGFEIWAFTKIWKMFILTVRNDHLLYSLYDRDIGSNLSNKYRVFSLGDNHTISGVGKIETDRDTFSVSL